MLTVTCEPTETQNNTIEMVENLPSDTEIMRRVDQIRAGWSASERAMRRIQAEHRFADLLDQLCVVEAA